MSARLKQLEKLVGNLTNRIRILENEVSYLKSKKKKKKIKNIEKIRSDYFSILPSDIVKKILFGYLPLVDFINFRIAYRYSSQIISTQEFRSFLKHTIIKNYKQMNKIRSLNEKNENKCVFCNVDIDTILTYEGQPHNKSIGIHVRLYCKAIYPSIKQRYYDFSVYTS